MFWHENSLSVSTLTAGSIAFGDMMAGILDRDSLRNPTVIRVIAQFHVAFQPTNGLYDFGLRIWVATEQSLQAGAIPVSGASVNSLLRQTFSHSRSESAQEEFEHDYDLRGARRISGPERTLALAFYNEGGSPTNIERLQLNFRLLVAYG